MLLTKHLHKELQITSGYPCRAASTACTFSPRLTINYGTFEIQNGHFSLSSVSSPFSSLLLRHNLLIRRDGETGEKEFFVTTMLNSAIRRHIHALGMVVTKNGTFGWQRLSLTCCELCCLFGSGLSQFPKFQEKQDCILVVDVIVVVVARRSRKKKKEKIASSSSPRLFCNVVFGNVVASRREAEAVWEVAAVCLSSGKPKPSALQGCT